MKAIVRVLLIGALLALNVALGARRMAAEEEQNKGHCEWSSGTCVIPCDHMNHFCVCNSSQDCQL